MEHSAWPKNASSSRKHTIQDLLHSQNPRKRRPDLFDAHSQTGNNTGQPLLAKDRVVNVLRSFSDTLSPSSSAQSDEFLRVPSNACVKSEVSEGSDSINSPLPRKPSSTSTRLDQNLIDNGHQWSIDDQKAILNLELPEKTSDTRTRLDHNLIDEGHQSRKYGQKEVLLPDFPRCTHKFDQGCQAAKQVQKIQDDPPVHRTIYQGHRTCKNLGLKSASLIQDKPSPGDSSIVNFNTSLTPNQDDDNDDEKTADAWTRLHRNLIDDGHEWSMDDQKLILNFEKTSVTQTRLDHILIDDGYSWREYVYKSILNCEFPRQCFSCAFRFDQGCLATKEVRKMQNDPPVYKTVYYGHHTCGNPIVESPLSSSIHQAPRDSSILFSGNTSLIAKQANNNDPLFYSAFSSVNNEQRLPCTDDLNPHSHRDDDNSNNNNQYTLSDYYGVLEFATEI